MSLVMFRMLMSAILTLVAVALSTGDGDGSAAPDRANSLAGKCVRGKMKGGGWSRWLAGSGPAGGNLGAGGPAAEKGRWADDEYVDQLRWTMLPLGGSPPACPHFRENPDTADSEEKAGESAVEVRPKWHL